jgi:hypothetical protein
MVTMARLAKEPRNIGFKSVRSHADPASRREGLDRNGADLFQLVSTTASKSDGIMPNQDVLPEHWAG